MEIRSLGIEDGNPLEEETAALLHIAEEASAQIVFEIGTFTASTALALAALPSVRKMWTLDIPKEQPPKYPILKSDRAYLAADKPPFPSNLHQLWGDSATFDYEPYECVCDLVFVMGAHSLDYVFNDIDVAFRLIRHHGIIVWHGGTPYPISMVRNKYALELLSYRMAIVRS